MSANYKVYESKLIQDKHTTFLRDTDVAFDKLQKMSENKDKTWLYDKYNFFNLVGGSSEYYDLFQELKWCIRHFTDYKGRLWMYCWLNYHEQEAIGSLKWHNHTDLWHGYIAIDPKNTTTQFKEWEIQNKIGQIYIGPGNKDHRVLVNEPYEGPRITLGFNVYDENSPLVTEKPGERQGTKITLNEIKVSALYSAIPI